MALLLLAAILGGILMGAVALLYMGLAEELRRRNQRLRNVLKQNEATIRLMAAERLVDKESLKGPACRFGDGPAVAIFDLPGGCLCFPEDRQQALCPHHACKARANGVAMILVQDLTVGTEFTHWWEGKLLRRNDGTDNAD